MVPLNPSSRHQQQRPPPRDNRPTLISVHAPDGSVARAIAPGDSPTSSPEDDGATTVASSVEWGGAAASGYSPSDALHGSNPKHSRNVSYEAGTPSYDGFRAADGGDSMSPDSLDSFSVAALGSGGVGGSGGSDCSKEPLPAPLKGYLIGQLAHVLKLGVWWTIFGPLLLSIFHGHVYGICLTRISFNTSLMIASPLAAILVERVAVRSILLWTVSLRGLIYCVALPLVWILLESSWIVDYPSEDDPRLPSAHAHDFGLLLLGFVGLVFIDGLVVAASNVVDIDCDGVLLVARQHLAPMRPNLQQQMMQMHEWTFEGSMILLAPLLAVAAQAACGSWNADSELDKIHGLSGPIFLLALALLFLVCSIVSLIAYGCNIPSLTSTQFHQRVHMPGVVEEYVDESGRVSFALNHSLLSSASPPNQEERGVARSDSLSSASGGLSSFQERSNSMSRGSSTGTDFGGVSPSSPGVPPQPSVSSEVVSMCRMLVAGSRLCWCHSAIRHRLWLLSVQTALEDAMICVLIPVVSSVVVDHALTDRDDACFYGQSNVLAMLIISAAKIASLVMSRVRTRGWVSQSTLERWTRLRRASPNSQAAYGEAPSEAEKGSSFIANSIAASAVMIALFPLAAYVLQSHTERDGDFWTNTPDDPGAATSAPDSTVAIALVIIFVATIGFFALSSFPKMLLAQGIQIEAEHVARREEHRRGRAEREALQRQHEESLAAQEHEVAPSFLPASSFLADVATAPYDAPVDVSRSLFGFVAAWLTCVDSLVLGLVAAVFAASGSGQRSLYNRGLLLCGACVLLHGIAAILAGSICCGASLAEEEDELLFEAEVAEDAHRAAVEQHNHDREESLGRRYETDRGSYPTTPIHDGATGGVVGSSSLAASLRASPPYHTNHGAQRIHHALSPVRSHAQRGGGGHGREESTGTNSLAYSYASYPSQPSQSDSTSSAALQTPQSHESDSPFISVTQVPGASSSGIINPPPVILRQPMLKKNLL